MEKIIAKLNEKFQSFTNDEGDSYVTGLIDYVEFIKELQAAEGIITKLENQHQSDLKKISQARKRDDAEKTIVSGVQLERAEQQYNSSMTRAWNNLRAVAAGGCIHDNLIESEIFLSAKRFHNYLVDRLELQENDTDNIVTNIEFDESRGILKINDKIIKLSKTSRQFEVLRIIFQSKNETYKDWQFSEISDKLDWAGLKEWKKIYNIVDAIGLKIAAKTGIQDFFITTTQSVKINPEYTPKS